MDQAPVIQKVDNAIHRIVYPLDSAIAFPNTYPLDSDLSGGQRYPSFQQLGPRRPLECLVHRLTGCMRTWRLLPIQLEIPKLICIYLHVII